MALSALVMVGEASKWLDELVDRAKKLRIDGGFEPGADLGPLISPESKQRVEDLIASAEAEGATILLDGRGQKPEKYPNGNWVSSNQTSVTSCTFAHESIRSALPSSRMSSHT